MVVAHAIKVEALHLAEVNVGTARKKNKAEEWQWHELRDENKREDLAGVVERT